jgi:hypothetical protein
MFYIEPLKFPNVAKPDTIKAVNPCFNVGKTTDSTKANMEVFSLEFSGYVFQCFRNTTDIKKYDPLCVFGEDVKYVPFSSCMSVEKVGEGKRRRLSLDWSKVEETV